MNITLNGNPLDIPENCSLKQLIELEGLTGRRLAAEVNLEIIPKAQHESCILKPDDRVEIVHAIGGG